MRILTVSNVPLLASTGSGYVIAGYVDRMRARGHHVKTLEPRDYLRRPGLGGARRLRTLLGYTRATLRAVAAEEFDVVELWGGESWQSARTLAAGPQRPLLVARSNGLEPHARRWEAASGLVPRPSFAGRLFDRWQRVEDAFRRVDALTLVSTFDAAFAHERGYQPADRMRVLENPLLDDWLGQPPPTSRPPVLGYFGSWSARKGNTILPAVITETLRAHPAWRAQLVGPGPEVATEFADDLRARIEFVPHVHDKAQLQSLYRGVAVVLMPSVYESFGLVTAEAMACGCAVVASPVGFAAGLRPDEEALLVSELTSAVWTHTMCEFLRTPSRIAAVAGRGQAAVQRLRWNDAVEELEAFYHEQRARHALRDEPPPRDQP